MNDTNQRLSNKLRCNYAAATIATTATAITTTNDADIDHADKKDDANNIQVKHQSVILSSDIQLVKSCSVNQS